MNTGQRPVTADRHRKKALKGRKHNRHVIAYALSGLYDAGLCQFIGRCPIVML